MSSYVICNVVVLDGPLCIVSILPDFVLSAAWWIIRQFIVHPMTLSDNSFRSLLSDDDGLSLVCCPDDISSLQELNLSEFHLSPKRWRALVIHIFGSVTQFPGTVYHLARLLSDHGISIFHISTFEREVFLVQEDKCDEACNILRQATLSDEFLSLKDFDSELPPPATLPSTSNFTLGVVPGFVMLAKLREESEFKFCESILLKLILYDERYNEVELQVAKASGRTSTHRECTPIQKALKATFLWGFWRCEDELTFLLDESDIEKFPEDSLIVSPQRWKVVKLCGRAIEFDETGIVAAMSRLNSDVPTLNISTSTTNCTLVPEENLHETLDMLSKALMCNVQDDIS